MCSYLLDVCRASKVKSDCTKECAAIIDKTGPCGSLTKEKVKQAKWCDGYNPGEIGYTEFTAALLVMPLDYCGLINQMCNLVTAAGKCTLQCKLMMQTCKNGNADLNQGCVDIQTFFRGTCRDKTCASSEFCFCPQNGFQSCKSCKPGCKLQPIDLNGHHECVEGVYTYYLIQTYPHAFVETKHCQLSSNWSPPLVLPRCRRTHVDSNKKKEHKH